MFSGISLQVSLFILKPLFVLFRLKYSALGTSLAEEPFACLMFDRFSLRYNHRWLDDNLPTFEKRQLYSHLYICTEVKTSATLICLKWFGISRLHLLTGVPHMLHLFKHGMSSIWSYASDWKHSIYKHFVCHHYRGPFGLISRWSIVNAHGVCIEWED